MYVIPQPLSCVLKAVSCVLKYVSHRLKSVPCALKSEIRCRHVVRTDEIPYSRSTLHSKLSPARYFHVLGRVGLKVEVSEMRTRLLTEIGVVRTEI